jgi:hypothetical protein
MQTLWLSLMPSSAPWKGASRSARTSARNRVASLFRANDRPARGCPSASRVAGPPPQPPDRSIRRHPRPVRQCPEPPVLHMPHELTADDGQPHRAAPNLATGNPHRLWTSGVEAPPRRQKEGPRCDSPGPTRAGPGPSLGRQNFVGSRSVKTGLVARGQVRRVRTLEEGSRPHAVGNVGDDTASPDLDLVGQHARSSATH